MALLAVVPALVLSGCDLATILQAGPAGSGGGGGVAKLKLNASYTGTATEQPGTGFTPGPNGTTNIQNKTLKGTFASKLPKKIDPTPKNMAAFVAGGGLIKAVSGSFVSQMSGNFNPATNSGTLSGVQVLKFSGPIGEACLALNSTSSNGGQSEKGTFTLVGGTKIAAKARFSGTYSASQTPTGFTGTISGKGKLGKSARPHNAACKAIRGQL